jgi:hypothetical protein
MLAAVRASRSGLTSVDMGIMLDGMSQIVYASALCLADPVLMSIHTLCDA